MGRRGGTLLVVSWNDDLVNRELLSHLGIQLMMLIISLFFF